MGKFFKWFWLQLGNSKAQRFRRLLCIIIIFAIVIMYGFYTGGIHFEKVFGGQP